MEPPKTDEQKEKLRKKEEEKEEKRQKCEKSIKKPADGWGKDFTDKLASMSKQVLINASPDNDFGFDIHPNNRYSPYKCIDCEYAGNDLKQLQCAKTKYMSKVGMKLHQDLRKNKYRSLISRICTKNKQLACSKNALPVHDICNCENKNMKITDIFGQAMVFYRELSELIEGQTMSKADYDELLRKAADKMDKAGKSLKKGASKGYKAAKIIGKSIATDGKALASPITSRFTEKGRQKKAEKKAEFDKQVEEYREKRTKKREIKRQKPGIGDKFTSGVKTVKSKAGKVKKVVSNPFTYKQKEEEKEAAIQAAQLEISKAASKSGEKLSNQQKQDIANKAMEKERELIREENKELEGLKKILKNKKKTQKNEIKTLQKQGNVDAARKLINTRLTKEKIKKQVEDTRKEMLRKRREEIENQKNRLSLGQESEA